MTGQQILNAIPIVKKLTLIELPFKKAYQVYSLTKQINEKADFFINEEKKIIQKFNATILNNGQIKFEKVEDRDAFLKEHGDLFNINCEDINPVELSFNDLNNTSLSPAEIKDLEGVIIFID